MPLNQARTLQEVVDFFTAHPHDNHPAPSDVIELPPASIELVKPDNHLYWDIWRSDYTGDNRYPFIDGEAKLMFSRQVAIGNDTFSATIVFPFDLKMVIAKVAIDRPAKTMTIWVYKNARYWQYIRSLGQAIARVFNEYEPASMNVGTELLKAMDSQTPGHAGTAAVGGF